MSEMNVKATSKSHNKIGRIKMQRQKLRQNLHIKIEDWCVDFF